VLAGIVLLCVGLRAVYFEQMSAGPGIWQHRWAPTDMHFFDGWARDIAEGDWLTDRPLHPIHHWHQVQARAYLEAYPSEATELARAESAGDARDPAGALWDRWYGGKRFHQAPLYPYLVAATYALAGPDARWVFGWQLALGVLSVVLVHEISRRYYGSGAAAVGALLAALCAPLLYYDLLLLRATPMVFAGLLLVLLTDVALKRGRARWWALVGGVGGAAILLKPTHALFLAGTLIGLVSTCRRQPRRALRFSAAMALGLALALAPLAVRNLAVGVPPLAVSGVGPVGLINALAEDTVARQGLSMGSRHLPRIMHGSDGRFLPVLLGTLETHESAGTFARHLLVRLRTALSSREIPNNSNFYYFRMHAPILAWLPVGCATVACLALPGVLLSLADFRRGWPLHLFALSSLMTVVVFGVLSRYRLPLLAALLPFAALTCVRLVRWLRRGPRAALVGCVAAVAGLALLLSGGAQGPLIRASDYKAPYDYHYRPRARDAATAGDVARAAQVFADSLRYEAPVLRELGPDRPARSRHEAQLARLFAQARTRYAQWLERGGRIEEAARERRRAEELRAAAHRDS
jgi:4-amino-4-deoxy-L-arabinose transferase-like glycosyltransferase